MFALLRSWIVVPIFAVSVGTAYAAPVHTDTPLPLETAVDIVGLEAYGPIASVSPDGSLAAYTVSVAHVHELRLLPLDGGKGSKLTNAKEDAHSPMWSPDGRRLAFFNRSIEQPGNQFHLWLYESGKAKQISDAPVATLPPWLRPQWTKDGQSIVVAIAAPDATAELEPKVERKFAAVEVFRAYREGYPDRLPSTMSPHSEGIGVIDVRTGTLRKLASGLVYAYQLDPSGSRLAVIIRPPRTDTDVISAADELQVIDLKTGVARTLFNAVSSAYAIITWSPDGRYLSWAQDYPPDIGTAYLAAVDEGKLRRITAEPPAMFAGGPYGAMPILWDTKSRRFFAIADGQLRVGAADEGIARLVTKSDTWKISALVSGSAAGTAASDDDHNSVTVSVVHRETLEQGFARVDLATGALRVLIKTDGHFSDVMNRAVVLRDNRVLYHAESAHEAGSLLLSEDLRFQAQRRLAALNPQLVGRAFGASRLLTWKNSRGDVLQGSVLMPSDYVPGRRYPVKLNVYAEGGAGDRKGVFGASDGFNGQVYATRGFVVFTPDTSLRIGTPAADLEDDVKTGMQALSRSGFVDESRVSCSGESYGGYNVLLLATNETICRNAISRSGFSDITTAAYGNPSKGAMVGAWAEKWQGRMGGPPWQSPEIKQRYIDNSPFWKLDAIENTPVLLLHGLKDDTVPSHASILTFYGLKRMKKPVEVVLFPTKASRRIPIVDFVDYQRLPNLHVVWKSIESLGRIGVIARAVPECRTIVILRHPCGYIASVLKGEDSNRFSAGTASGDDFPVFEMLLRQSPHKERNPSLEEIKNLPMEERLAWRWLLYNEISRAGVSSLDRCLSVRYEDLCSDPLSKARELLSFAGLDWDRQVETFIHRSTTRRSSRYYSVYKDPLDSATKWQQQLTPLSVERILRVVSRSDLAEIYLKSCAPQTRGPASASSISMADETACP